MQNRYSQNLFRDVGIVVLSILVAILLVRTGAVRSIVDGAPGGGIIQSFIAGFFFTSAFTTVPAILVLGTIAASGSIFQTAFFGALGALAGDLIIFRFLRDDLAEDFAHLMSRAERERFRHIFHRRLFRWFTPFLGALIIASPLPDELGLALLGFSKTRTGLFVPFSFCANFAGILAIGLVSRGILS